MRMISDSDFDGIMETLTALHEMINAAAIKQLGGTDDERPDDSEPVAGRERRPSTTQSGASTPPRVDANDPKPGPMARPKVAKG